MLKLTTALSGRVLVELNLGIVSNLNICWALC